jgi:hypothetical protein
MSQYTSRPMSGQIQHCIDECSHCHAHCSHTIQHCLGLGDRHAEPGHIGMLLDCSELCQLAANFMIRESRFHTRLCALCAEICEQCAQDCDKLADDPEMRTCAEACRSCAAACRETASIL